MRRDPNLQVRAVGVHDILGEFLRDAPIRPVWVAVAVRFLASAASVDGHSPSALVSHGDVAEAIIESSRELKRALTPST